MGSQTEYPCLYLHSHTSSFLQGVSFWIYPLNTYVHLCDEADTKYTSLMLCISYGWKTPNHVYSSASVYYWNICLKWLHSSLYKMFGFIPRVKSLSHISLSHFKKKSVNSFIGCSVILMQKTHRDTYTTMDIHKQTHINTHRYTQMSHTYACTWNTQYTQFLNCTLCDLTSQWCDARIPCVNQKIGCQAAQHHVC